jgi:ubiquinone/menaquinone biosynthesis C-methylase UbiE
MHTSAKQLPSQDNLNVPEHEQISGALDDDKIKENIEWNKKRWGQLDKWNEVDSYGYRWGKGVQQKYNGATLIAEKYLLPYVGGRRDLTILEVAPGAGRFTTELIRIAGKLYLLDLNQACIDICKERFKYYTHIEYFVNDGVSCDMVPDNTFDLIATYDSFVHVEPAVIREYLRQFVSKLVPGGIIWIDHSGRGERELGHRTAMTDKLMMEYASEFGLKVITQRFRNDHDCISILQKRQ